MLSIDQKRFLFEFVHQQNFDTHVKGKRRSISEELNRKESGNNLK